MNCSRLGNATNVIHFNLLLFRPIYYSVSTRKWKSIGIGNSTIIEMDFKKKNQNVNVKYGTEGAYYLLLTFQLMQVWHYSMSNVPQWYTSAMTVQLAADHFQCLWCYYQLLVINLHIFILKLRNRNQNTTKCINRHFRKILIWGGL